MSDQDLMNTFKFEEADRLANQAGRMSGKQKARFIAEDRYAKKWARIGGIFMLVSALLGLALLLYLWIKASGNTSVIMLELVACAIWSLLWGSIGATVLWRLSARSAFTVASVQGHARIVDVQSSYANNRIGIHQELHIGGKRFVGTRMLATHLPAGEYIVYYFDRPARHRSGITYPGAAEDILSVELLKEGEAAPAPEPESDHDGADPEIMACIRNGDEEGAIRRHRSLTNSTYEEAKKSVEMLAARLED
jgi:hypothetical protein